MSTLNIAVTVGKQFADSELITAAKLNQILGNAVFALIGTIASGTIGDGSITTPKLADGILTADAAGRLKMADLFVTQAKLVDGILTADGAGRAKMADSFVIQAKLADGILTADAPGRLKMASDYVNSDKVQYGSTVLATSGNVTIDWSIAMTVSAVLTNNITFDFSTAKDGQTLVIAVQQAGAGAKTVTWTPTIRWRGGTAPVLTTTANKTDVFTILKVGAVYYGNYSQNY